MKNIINSIRESLKTKNWYAALFVALTLPDICVALENGGTTGGQYAEWFEKNLPAYKNFLNGSDCYALRCSLLHQGKDDISDQRMKQILGHYIFLTSGSHCNLFRDCEFNGIKKSFLQLNVQIFCTDLCDATEKWLKTIEQNSVVAQRLQNTIKVHEPGYSYMSIVKFG